MAFRLFFFKTSWSDQNSSTKSSTKFWERRQIVPVGPRNWTKKVSRVTLNTGRDQMAPLDFFRHCATFFSIFFSTKGSPFNCFGVLKQNGCWKIPKGPPFQFFSALRLFKKNSWKVSNSSLLWRFEVILLFLSLRYGADLGRSRLVKNLFNHGVGTGETKDATGICKQAGNGISQRRNLKLNKTGTSKVGELRPLLYVQFMSQKTWLNFQLLNLDQANRNNRKWIFLRYEQRQTINYR